MVQEDLATSIALQVGELGFLSDDYILYRAPPQGGAVECEVCFDCRGYRQSRC